MRKVCVVTTHRSDFSRLEPVLNAMRRHRDLEVILVAGGSHMLPDAGETINDIRSRGHLVHARAHTIVEGENLETMAKSIGLGCIEFASIFERFLPDIVILHGDRFDIFPAAVAAATANIRIAHLQGGEITGTIDEFLRHSITKLAHWHFVSNTEAAQRVEKLGEDRSRIFNVGCPSVDAMKFLSYPTRETFGPSFLETYSGTVDPREPYLLLIQHPVTTEFSSAADHMDLTIQAILKTSLPTILIYPNIDAGSKQMVSKLRKLSRVLSGRPIDMFKHISVSDFWTLLKYSSCIVGNSSAGIREACYFGIPCVNIGSRQNRRARGKNVKDVGHHSDEIAQAVMEQVAHGIYPVEEIYGDGHASEKIAQMIAEEPLPLVQKTITY